MRKLLLLCAVVVAIVAAPAAYGTPISPSEASSTVATLYLGTTSVLSPAVSSVTIKDEQPGDSWAGPGTVVFAGNLGTLSINVTTGLTTPPLSYATMDLNSVNVQTGVYAAELEIWWSDPELDRPFELPLNYVMNIGGTIPSGMELTYKAFWGEAGKVFDTSNEIGALEFETSGAFSGTTSKSFAGIPETYSLTQAIFISAVTGGSRSVSFNAELTPTPEPGMMLLVGFGLVVFGAVARRLRSN